MSCIKVLLTSLCILAFGSQSFAQLDSIIEAQQHKKKANTTNNAVLISPYYAGLFPLGELSQRFGYSSNVGLTVTFKVKRNWLIGLEGSYLFGGKVKEDPISNSIGTYSAQSQIIGQDNSLITPTLALSGFEVAFRVGKLIKLTRKHPNSGIVISIAPGFIQHKIQITANANNFPQLNSTYKKGYDRLTNGPSIAGYLGYLFLEKKKFLSFYGGLDYTVGFTKNRRNWNFDLMSADTHQRIDMLIGFKIGWVIPIFTNKESEVYYK